MPLAVWAMDEHRLGLKPIVRRVWVPRGEAPTVTVLPRYEWLYLYGFVEPATGATFWLLLPSVNVALMARALAEFARAVGAGPERRVLLVLDGAGWHISAKLVVPDGIELVRLPPYSPELQPAERLWALTDDPVANRVPKDLDALEDTIAERCRVLTRERALVRGRTQFHWWPTVQAA